MRLQGARRRDDAHQNNSLKSADDDAVCLHWVKGLCKYGDECAHKHSLPPFVDQQFVDLMHELRAAETAMSALRLARAPSDVKMAAVARLRELQLQLRALQQQAIPGKEGRSSRGRRRQNNIGRAAALQRFLFETYGKELMSSGCGLLDVAGGNCDFAWNALNWHGLSVTVVDPRPSLLPRRFARAWAHRMRDGKEIEVQAKAAAEVGAEDVEPAGARDTSSCRVPKVPTFWPVYWRDELWRPVADAAALTPQQVAESVEAALHSAPASRASARRSRKADDRGGDSARTAAAEGAAADGIWDDGEEEERSDDEGEAANADAGGAACVLPAALQHPPTVPAAPEACRVLRECSIAVGMHPD